MSEASSLFKPEPLAEGIWQVDTETSTYIYDVHKGVVTRLPGGAGILDGAPIPRFALRRDGEQIPVIEASTPVVGRCWGLCLEVRRDGVKTWRTTTIVCHMVRLG